MVSEKSKTLSRREFVIGAGALVAGAVGIAAIPSEGLNLSSKAEAEAKGKSRYPWEYQKIVDLDRVGQTAYDKWFDVFCAQATATSLFEQLREKVGEPYISFPLEALRFGMGGMVGWGLTCGSLVSGSLFIGLTVPGETGDRMINDLVKWYADTTLPNFKPKVIKATIIGWDGKERPFKGDFKNLTVARSPLCHQSVGRFMKKNGADWDSDPRRNRCAMISASVAVKIAEILNGWIESGKYVPVYGPQLKLHKIPLRKDIKIAAQNNCGDCHNPFTVGYKAIRSRTF